jgi:hypothetical protein
LQFNARSSCIELQGIFKVHPEANADLTLPLPTFSHPKAINNNSTPNINITVLVFNFPFSSGLFPHYTQPSLGMTALHSLSTAPPYCGYNAIQAITLDLANLPLPQHPVSSGGN